MKNNVEKFSLSLTQKDIYFDQLHHTDSPLYNIGGFVRCHQLDIERMRQAHEHLLLNHDVFGIRIVDDGDDVKQYIHPHRTTELPLINFSEAITANEDALQWLDYLFQKPMTYHESELCQAYLLKISNNEYWYVGLSHHLAMDGWGFSNWAHKLADYYNQLDNSAKESDNWQAIVVKDQQYLKSKRYQNDRTFWFEHFDKLPEEMLTPFYLSNFEDVNQIPSTRYRLSISRSLFQEYSQVAARMDVGIPQLFLGMLTSYFSSVYERSSIVFGIPAHNRKNFAQKKMLGVFTSVSPLMIKVDKSECFTALVKGIAKLQKKSFRHQSFPIGHLMGNLGLTGASDSLYHVSFNYLKMDYSDLAFDNIGADVVYHSHNRDKVPLTVTIWDGDSEDIELQLDYNHAYFNSEEIRMLGHRFLHLLKLLTSPVNDETPLSELSILPEPEIKLLCHQLNDNRMDYPDDQFIHEMFELQTKKTPDNIAVEFESQQLTYFQLNELANRLAHYLRESGIQIEDFVGVCLNRSPDMLIAILAILKAGGAYVSLDPKYPQNRLEYILEDTSLKFVLTESRLRSIINTKGNIRVIELDSDDFLHEQKQYSAHNLTHIHGHLTTNLAYVIYTSGSTGKPKGVMIEHRNTVAFLHWGKKYFTQAEMECVLASTSLNFDLSVFELFAPLTCGGRCLIVGNILALLENSFSDKGLTMINTVPSGASAVLKESRIPESVITVNLAGEPLSKALVNELHQQLSLARVVNLYGPSEDTTYSTVMSMSQEVKGNVLIGKPINNTQAYVLTRQGKLSPMGEVGELYLGGDGVSRGYLNQSRGSHSSFTKNPFTTGAQQRLYKTGDLVRYMPDGNLAFIGRIDEQIKIRGFRVELGEIEHQLLKCQDVVTALVLAQEDESGNKQLVAYIERRDTVDKTQLKAKLIQLIQTHLPQYMLPSAFLFIEQWPLTPNGKVDKKALPSPDYNSASSIYVAPTSTTEHALVNTWGELLNFDVQELSITANFFQVGGNSLLSSKMIHRCNQQHKFPISIKDIFECPTIQSLALRIKSNQSVSEELSTVLSLKKCTYTGAFSLSFTQYRIWFVEQLEGQTNKHNVNGGVKISGNLDIDEINKTIAYLVAKHSILQTRIILDPEGQPKQFFDPELPLKMDFIDFTFNEPEDKEQEVFSKANDFGTRIFDLYNGALFSIMLAKLSDNDWRLFVNFHHIISDGWSIISFFNEFMHVYGKQESEGLSESLSFDYHDYVMWQNTFINTPLAKVQSDFWSEYLNGSNQSLKLPFKSPSELESENGEVIFKHAIDPKTQSRLLQLAKKHKASLFNVVHCAVVNVLSRLTGVSDLNLGIPITGRNLAGVEDVLGAFINNLPIRSQIDLSITFDKFIIEQTKNVANALSHQDLPFEQILSTMDIERSGESTPLFQVVLNVLSLPELNLKNDHFDVEVDFSPKIASKFDITIYVDDTLQGTNFTCNFNTEKYSNVHIRLVLAQIIGLLNQVAIDSTKPCGAYSLLTQSEAVSFKGKALINEQILPDPTLLIETVCDIRAESVNDLFDRVAEKTPDALAVHYRGENWSYGDLYHLTQVLGSYLQRQGIGAGDVVAIMAQRNHLLVMATLAILKTGAAFVMLSNDTPVDKLFKQIELTSPAGLLLLDKEVELHQEVDDYLSSQRCLKINVSQLMVEFIDTTDERVFESVKASPDALAYIGFTSGTEAEPKLIRGRHSALSQYLNWTKEQFALSSESKFAMISGLLHDPLQRDMFTPLCIGAKLYIPEDTQDSIWLGQWLNEQQINTLNMTPSFSTFLWADNQVKLSSLKTVFMGGEPLTQQHLQLLDRVSDELRIVNLYGATETCRALGYFEVPPALVTDLSVTNVPIGKGVAGSQLIILNQHHQQCAIGELGQIGIRSRYMSLGYLNNIQETASKFIVNPFNLENDDQDIIYLTGDFGRYLDDGNVICLGRLDRQIKIRGFRIEPAEIEFAISSHPLIESVAVVVKEGNVADSYLVAYVTLNDKESKQIFDANALRLSLKSTLLDYMLPQTFYVLDELPLTVNGKLDTSELERLNVAELKIERAIIAPTTEVEEKLLSLWQEILNCTDVSTEDDFFKIGGHSLLTTKVLSRIQLIFGVSIAFKDFFEDSRIKNIAAHIESAKMVSDVINKVSKKNKISL
jgi:amino acid adenylation domain-containing protein